MLCTVFVNTTDINRDGTLLDEIDLRFTYDIEYESLQVPMSKFKKDVRTAYTNHYRAKRQIDQDETLPMSEKFFIRIVNKSDTNEQYFPEANARSKQLPNLRDLLLFLNIIKDEDNFDTDAVPKNCDIHVEALPKFCWESGELIDLIGEQIPVKMIFKEEISHTSIEWNDMDSLIIQYIVMYRQFIISKHVTGPPFGTTRSRLADMLKMICFYYVWRRLVLRDKPWEKDIINIVLSVLEHLLYFYDIYTEGFKNIGGELLLFEKHSLFVEIYGHYCNFFYLKKKLLPRVLIVEEAEYSNLIPSKLTPSNKSKVSVLHSVIADTKKQIAINKINLHMCNVNIRKFLRVLKKANKLCQIGFVDDGGKCVTYMFDQLVYDRVLNHAFPFTCVNMFPTLTQEGELTRRFYNLQPCWDTKFLAHCVIFMLQLFIMFIFILIKQTFMKIVLMISILNGKIVYNDYVKLDYLQLIL